MNGDQSKIEIFAPFGAAFELMKRILFQPFDLRKWFVIGFAAFLSHLSGGSGSNFNSRAWKNANWDFHSVTHNTVGTSGQMPAWVIPLIVLGVLAALAITAVFLWIGSRGRFIFTDCIVRNRGAIAEPWNEFRREGNSFFLFSVVVALVVLGIALIAFVPVLLPLLHGISGDAAAFTWTIGLVFFIAVVLVIAVAWSLISQLMVPIMYRRRCSAMEAFRAAVGLIKKYPGPIILYLLFLFVLGMASAMVACLLACVTCCITAIPYIGTVILLPIYVLLAGFTLIFLRQFGPDYDVWAGAVFPEPAVTTITSPPIQPPPASPPTFPTS
jgi:hypothetical protein